MNISWEEICKVRSKVYGFLGTLLLEPIQNENGSIIQCEFWQEFPLEANNDRMKAGLDKLIECTKGLEKYPVAEAVLLTQIEFTHLFHGPGQPQAPPWESYYRTPEKVLSGWPTLQVREVYRQHGFEIAARNKQFEDHMGLELIFLASVSEVLGQAFKDQDYQTASAIIKGQQEFITGHPLTWISEFASDACSPESIGFYPALIELIWGLLLEDSDLLSSMLEDVSNQIMAQGQGNIA